jgi:hypothetical protein
VVRLVKKEQARRKRAVVGRRDWTPRTTSLELEMTTKALMKQDNDVALWPPSK